MATGGGVTSVESVEKCAVCANDVKPSEQSLCCDLCGKWVHTRKECGKVPMELYKTIKKFRAENIIGIKWICERCDTQFEKFKSEMKMILEKQVALENKQETMEATMIGMKEDIIEIRKVVEEWKNDKIQTGDNEQEVVDDKIDKLKEELTELKQTYSSMVRVNNREETNNSNVINPSSRSVQLEVSEAMEREKRKNNLVIFGIEETNDENLTKDKVKEIVIAVGLEESKIQYFGRVGRNLSGTKTRVVRVVCSDLEVKRKFLKEASKLKGLQGYNKVYVSPDLTKSQQIIDKKLRDKLREIRTEHREAKINNGDIVIFEEGNRRVLYAQQH